ncbi:histidine kinase [Paenibacillus yonginensis]|uniref:histidine kinase n=1 Tax=Paenibacillus yonginensis TaxID=1462996 RepID=A0A1B1N576_9BACL|nr:sensor histidine kinase [Paenibacillus yonginensis]ANS76579.1 histidine kinase [Paenibacillus yonginensis]
MWFRNSLKSKLSVLLIAAIVFPLLATGIVSYRIASNLTEKIEKQSGMNTLQQISDKLDFIIGDAENMSVFIIGQKNIQSYLGSDRSDISLYSQNVAFLMNLASSKTYISNITITSNKGYPALSNTTIVRSGLPEVMRANEGKYNLAVKWWTPLYENQTTDNGLKQVFTLVRPIRSTDKFQNYGELSISIDAREVQRMLENAAWNESGHLWLINEENRVMVSQKGEGLNQLLGDKISHLGTLPGAEGVENVKLGDESSTLLYYTVPSLGWKLVGVIPTHIYTAQNQYVLTLTAWAIGISALFAGLLVLYFITWVTRPLIKVARKLNKIDPDEPIRPFEVKTTDEIGMLLRSYNRLSDRIERLKSQLQLNAAKKKEADIQALQAQINPHFLYNTLSSIHWIALMNKQKPIAEMVGALTDFLRFSLNDGKEFCTVGQEVAHAQNYVRIMSKRFQDKFEATFFIDPSIQDQTMLKLLLQPLIENSIMHGIQKRREKGSILVQGELRPGAMTFTVEDTGIGMEEAKLREIRHALQLEKDSIESQAEPDTAYGLAETVKSGYGLGSVHRRLILHYGSETGLQIESEPGTGTRITFTIPLLEGSA